MRFWVEVNVKVSETVAFRCKGCKKYVRVRAFLDSVNLIFMWDEPDQFGVSGEIITSNIFYN